MEQRNRRQIQQPDAPEPGNRVQTAVDVLLDPSVSEMRGVTFGRRQFNFFAPRGSEMHRLEQAHLEMTFGPQVLGPFPPGRSTLIPPNPHPPNPNFNPPANHPDSDDSADDE